MKKKTVQKPNKGKGKTITARKASFKKPAPKIPSHGKNTNPLGGWGDRPTVVKPTPPTAAKPAVPEWFRKRQEAITAPEGYVTPPKPKLPPRPPALTSTESRDLNTFGEGQVVDIVGCPDMQKLTIERISDGGVTVSGGKLAPSTVLSGKSPARIHFRQEQKDGTFVNVSAPYPGHGDFSSAKGGTVTITRDDGTDPVPAKERIKPHLPGATEADLPASLKKPAQKREGVCAFIDNLIMEGGRTAEEVCELTLAKFPGRDPKATLSTVKTRPAHIKAKGLVPPPFKK